MNAFNTKVSCDGYRGTLLKDRIHRPDGLLRAVMIDGGGIRYFYVNEMKITKHWYQFWK